MHIYPNKITKLILPLVFQHIKQIFITNIYILHYHNVYSIGEPLPWIWSHPFLFQCLSVTFSSCTCRSWWSLRLSTQRILDLAQRWMEAEVSSHHQNKTTIILIEQISIPHHCHPGHSRKRNTNWLNRHLTF